MDISHNDLPQAKASRQQQKVSHEFCQGYVDKNGIWNNGFYCRRWGAPDETYCCGDGRERFCCPEQTQSTPYNSEFSSVKYIPLIIGLSVGFLLLIIGIIAGYFFCPCCSGYKIRRKTKNKRTIVIRRRTLSVSMEAEATSAVIAAQALVPLKSCATPSLVSTSDDGHLHCGCQWSPAESSTTMVDIDSVATPMYQNTSAWKPELDNFIKNFSSDIRPTTPYCDIALKKDARPQTITTYSAKTSAQRVLGHNRQSPIGLKSSPANCASGSKALSDESKHTAVERTELNPSSLRRTYGLPEATRIQDICSGEIESDITGVQGGLSLLERDRQRRDSGVLIEDQQDTAESGKSMPALNIPVVELTSIGRDFAFGTFNKRKQTIRQH